MLIISCDQSEKNDAGFAVVDTSLPPAKQILYTYCERYRYIDDKGKDRPIPLADTRWRCMRFAKVLQDLLKAYPPDVVVTELVRAYHHGTSNKHTIAALSEIQGAINLIVRKPIPIAKINTGSWQAIMLSPKRGDDRKALSVRLFLQYYKKSVTEHEADAGWLALSYPLLQDNPNENIITILR